MIGRVRDATDIVAIIGEHVKLSKSGANYVGLCPFHSENTPSFSVVPGKKIFKCFGCDAKGDVFKFLKLKSNAPFADIIKELASKAGIPLEYDSLPVKSPRPAATKAKKKKSPSGEPDAGARAESADSTAAPSAVVSEAPEVVDASSEDADPLSDPAATPSTLAIAALREFYSSIKLSLEETGRLWQKRGLLPETALAFGLKSNPRSNLEILQSLAQKFPIAALLDAGLWVHRKGEAPKPNPMFYGYGRTSKKPKEQRRSENDKWNYAWCEPTLIPYFDDRGEVIFLRPHRDQVAGVTNRLFIPHQARQTTNDDKPESCRQALITEGELKILAALQVLAASDLGENKWAGAALPGITNAKSMFADILDWLDSIGAREVVIVYDNEDKSREFLLDGQKNPSFVAEEYDRYDSVAWARYLALQLNKEGFHTSVGNLPDEWRDEKGKADWDGALVHLLRKFSNTPVDQPLPDPAAVDKSIWDKVQDEFVRILKFATPVEMLRQSGLFDDKAERIIRNKIERFSRDRELPIGGEKEEITAKRIQRFIHKNKDDTGLLPFEFRAALAMLAKNYRTLNGRYYTFKRLTEKKEALWDQQYHKADQKENVEYKRIIEIAKRGIPKWISDFYIKAHYCLRKISGDYVRYVTLHTINGKRTKLLELPHDFFAAPSKFREWLLKTNSGAAWVAGERELQQLHLDINYDVAAMDVIEVAHYGYHEDSKIWFYHDCAFTPEGQKIVPDEKENERGIKKEIFWYQTKSFRQGYKLSKVGNAKQPFRLGFPKMHPEIPDPNLPELFREVSAKFIETVGWPEDVMNIGFDGLVVLGITFGSFAGPEIYQQHLGVPGLWIHGETQQGKNCITRWALPIQGFRLKTGIVLPRSTEAGLAHAVEQYSNMLAWMEEYQPEMARTKPWIIEVIKNCFDRSSGTKMVFNEELREIRAAAFVNGIATASDAQVKNRYAHVQVSEKFRKQNHYDWFEAHSKDFFVLGRHILRHRARFAADTIQCLNGWMDSTETAGIDSRAKIVYGTAYAAFHAAAKLFESEKSAVDFKQYRAFLCNKAREAVTEIRSQVNVNQFWTDLLSSIDAGAFGLNPSDLKKFFIVKENPSAKSPLPPDQQTEEFRAYAWKNYLLYFKPNAVIDILRRFKLGGHRDLPLEKNDLFVQMKTKAYMVPPASKTTGAQHRIRFAGKRSAEYCWCIDINKHEELGYLPVPTEQLRDSIKNPQYQPGDESQLMSSQDWSDPRQGDFFSLIYKLLKTDSE